MLYLLYLLYLLYFINAKKGIKTKLLNNYRPFARKKNRAAKR